MTTLYAAEAADALDALREAGAAVSFVRTTPGIHDPVTDTWTAETTTTVAGYAIEVRGDPDEYRDLELIASRARTLLFGSTTLGAMPEEGFTVTWGGTTYTARSRKPVAPDGTALLARIVVTL